MAPQRDLVKIGSEGFALIDEYFEKKTMNRAPVLAAATSTTTFRVTQQSCNYHYSSLESHVYRIIPSTRMEAIKPPPPPVLNNYEATQFHEGINLVNYSRRRQVRMAY
ncbi:hypothetical protein RND71_040358 [Anisodus tanguticus]|uniref:Uncharacterized protein n=1 Tax=Anisodus tanguticus TaxID=243964 RepID=A0AAE1QS06_9SOLA|nr:hypothetical protein RND71_040355 [Anisodus tanguticus]KAK4338894.1 hypothetical protein RND71_040356 [Anisodus tanguticus]KAK4338896.1 hypothetical protein RND71_040358 [Anisodus tanguticus]